MTKYRVPCRFVRIDEKIVEADSPEEAIELATEEDGDWELGEGDWDLILPEDVEEVKLMDFDALVAEHQRKAKKFAKMARELREGK